MSAIDMTDERVQALRRTLSRYVPETALDRLTEYIVVRGVHLRVARQRTSKYGDYRWPRKGQEYHAISVNGNLNKYFFLLVLLHEMAHLEVYRNYANRVQPHGLEWQAHYRRLLEAYRDCFTQEAQPLLDNYLKRLPLSHAAGNRLESLLKNYGQASADASATAPLTLNQLPAGSRFRLADKPRILFLSVEKRRTRWICRDEATGRLYSVKGDAAVVKE